MLNIFRLDDLKKPAEFSEKSEVESIEKVKPVQEVSLNVIK